MNDIYYRKLQLPYGIKGLVIKDPDGNYNVYVADWLSPDAEQEVLEHERFHIADGHLDRDDLPVLICEDRATYRHSR